MSPLRLASAGLCLILFPLAARAADFPPATETERALETNDAQALLLVRR